MKHGVFTGMTNGGLPAQRLKEEPTCRNKLVIVGDGYCGKTSLLATFISGKFPDGYVPTVFETHLVDLQLHEHCKMELVLWDTAGQENYDMLRPISYPNTDVFIVCFTVDNPDSFLNVCNKWVPEVRHFCPKVPIVLVGTKTDTRTNAKVISRLAKINRRPINPEEGIELGREIGAFAYVECSAMKWVGVKEVFTTAARAAVVKEARTRKRTHDRQCVLL